jgi:hypothetical protein
MRKAMRNYWLDVVMALLALGVGISALLLWVVLPQGYFATRLLWIQIHKWTGLGLSIAALLHVVLHWSWLVRMTKRVLERFSPSDPTSFSRRRQDPDWM